MQPGMAGISGLGQGMGEQKSLAEQQQGAVDTAASAYGPPDEFMSGGQMYQSGGMMQDHNGMMIMVIEAQPLETTLADLQGMASPGNWGHLDQNQDTMRKNNNLMGRVHRGPKHDGSAMISGSEKGGPRPAASPRKKTFRNGGRLYLNPLNKRSLTLSIL